VLLLPIQDASPGMVPSIGLEDWLAQWCSLVAFNPMLCAELLYRLGFMHRANCGLTVHSHSSNGQLWSPLQSSLRDTPTCISAILFADEIAVLALIDKLGLGSADLVNIMRCSHRLFIGVDSGGTSVSLCIVEEDFAKACVCDVEVVVLSGGDCGRIPSTRTTSPLVMLLLDEPTEAARTIINSYLRTRGLLPELSLVCLREDGGGLCGLSSAVVSTAGRARRRSQVGRSYLLIAASTTLGLALVLGLTGYIFSQRRHWEWSLQGGRLKQR
jgi:hypothetical protein